MARKCKAPSCGKRFEPTYNTMQPTCGSPACALEYAKSKQGQDEIRKARKRENKQLRRDFYLNDLSWWLKVGGKLSHHFGGNTAYWLHRWIVRVRDADKPCIMCGSMTPKGGKWDACHYRSRGAAKQLRFEPDNIHKGCTHCNTATTGDTGAVYRANLVSRIGEERAAELDADNRIHRWTIDECRAIRNYYRELCKAAGIG